jgi:hypothetical protein
MSECYSQIFELGHFGRSFVGYFYVVVGNTNLDIQQQIHTLLHKLEASVIVIQHDDDVS